MALISDQLQNWLDGEQGDARSIGSLASSDGEYIGIDEPMDVMPHALGTYLHDHLQTEAWAAAGARFVMDGIGEFDASASPNRQKVTLQFGDGSMLSIELDGGAAFDPDYSKIAQDAEHRARATISPIEIAVEGQALDATVRSTNPGTDPPQRATAAVSFRGDGALGLSGPTVHLPSVAPIMHLSVTTGDNSVVLIRPEETVDPEAVARLESLLRELRGLLDRLEDTLGKATRSEIRAGIDAASILSKPDRVSKRSALSVLADLSQVLVGLGGAWALLGEDLVDLIHSIVGAVR